MSITQVLNKIDGYKEEVIALQKSIVAIPALSPTYGESPEHTGELRKVEFLEKYLKDLGITDLERLDAPDKSSPDGIRPNLIARIKGESSERTVWLMAHTDVVPPGDMSKWTTNPYELKVDGDMIYGRGVEDNHQGLVAGMMAARALMECNVTPKWDVAILFVADEECGSTYGIQYVLEQQNPFKPADIIVVPDGGAADGSEIEVAEKGIMWVKFKLTGVQCHASMPDKGNNSMRAGAHLIVALDELHTIFDKKDEVFEPPISTFEPTKKEANVPNINTIPGEDVFYLDCRVLPSYSLDEVDGAITKMADAVAAKFNVKVEISHEQREEAAPATSTEAPVVHMLKRAVKDIYGIDAKPVGIGGGTVAAYLRRKELPCVVWSKMDETMHSPNENAKISNIIGDAKVIAHLTLSDV